MDEKYFFGKHVRDMPGLNTLRILEKRQSYIIKKVQNNIDCNNDKNSHLLDEIRAMEKSMNFIKWVINNTSNEIVKGTIEQYRCEDKHDQEITVDEEIENESGILKGILHEKFSKKHRLEIIISEYNKANFILLEEIKLKQDMVTWKKTAKIKMSLNKMEKIIKKVHEIIDN